MYLSRMQQDEVYLFKQAESRRDPSNALARYGFHTSFLDERDPEDSPGRRSIATNLLVAFEPAAAGPARL